MSVPSPVNQVRVVAQLLDQTDCVIFDFDGVIVDSEPFSLETLRETLESYGVTMTPDQVRARFLGKSLKAVERHLDDTRGAGASDGFAATWQDALFAVFRADLRPVPGVTVLLDQLDQAGLPYCVASSSSFERLGIAQDAAGLGERFSNLFSAEQVSRGKPAPDLFLLAASRMNVDAARCLVIEDSPHGIKAASEAGMIPVGFVGGSHLRGIEASHGALLMKAGAVEVLETLTHLTDGLSLARATVQGRPARMR